MSASLPSAPGLLFTEKFVRQQSLTKHGTNLHGRCLSTQKKCTRFAPSPDTADQRVHARRVLAAQENCWVLPFVRKKKKEQDLEVITTPKNMCVAI